MWYRIASYHSQAAYEKCVSDWQTRFCRNDKQLLILLSERKKAHYDETHTEKWAGAERVLLQPFFPSRFPSHWWIVGWLNPHCCSTGWRQFFRWCEHTHTYIQSLRKDLSTLLAHSNLTKVHKFSSTCDDLSTLYGSIYNFTLISGP